MEGPGTKCLMGNIYLEFKKGRKTSGKLAAIKDRERTIKSDLQKKISVPAVLIGLGHKSGNKDNQLTNVGWVIYGLVGIGVHQIRKGCIRINFWENRK